MIGKTYIELHLQNHSVRLTSRYLKAYSLVNVLEVHSVTETSDFASIFQKDLNTHCISILSIQDDDKSLKFFEEFESQNNTNLKESKKGLMIIADSPERDYEFVYFLVLGSDPLISSLNLGSKNFGMFCFSLEELTGSKVDLCLEYINQLKSVKGQMEALMKRLAAEEEKISKSISHSKDAIQYFDYENEKVKEKKRKVENSVRRKVQNIEELHEEILDDRNIYCTFCLNEFKSVMFLPCGHLELCQSCLENNFKMEIGDWNGDEKLCVTCDMKIDSAMSVSFS